jgi:3-methyladenine DNA glycosylase AlkD
MANCSPEEPGVPGVKEYAVGQVEPVRVEELAEEIAARLAALPDARTQTVRALRRQFTRRLAAAPARAVIDVALAVFARPGFVCRFVAYELVCHHRAALRSLGAKELKRFGRDLDCWEAVDTFACYLAGPAWRERQVPDQLIHGWAASPNRWLRRTALVCTVPLNNKARGGTGDAPRTLAVCRVLAGNRDDMVVKALSWALRELAKRDPAAVRGFLAGHEKVLAARVLREVRNKLTTGLKNPRRPA